MTDEKLTLDGLIHEFFPDGDFCRELRFNHMMMEIGHKAVSDFKKSLWHDASEEPERERPILLKYGDFFSAQMFFRNEKWDELTTYFGIESWCYIDDILLKEGGEQC